MKSSKSVQVTALTAIAALIVTACGGNSNVQHCVDDQGVVVDDAKCADAGNHGFRWYYVPRLFSIGSRVSGGSYSRSPGVSYTPRASAGSSSSLFGGSSKSSTVSRGGFGSTGKGVSVGG